MTRLEVEEDELGMPVTMKYHVKIPPRYSAVFKVNLHGVCEGTKIISANKQLMEANPNAFQQEISMKPENNYFPLVAITNLDHAKTLHLAKGEIVGFAHEEEVEMNYIEMTDVLEMAGIEERAPRTGYQRENGENTVIAARSHRHTQKQMRSPRIGSKQARSRWIQQRSPREAMCMIQRARSRAKTSAKQTMQMNLTVIWILSQIS